MSTTLNEITKSTEQLIELLKQLPKEKQEFVNEYIQGVKDTYSSMTFLTSSGFVDALCDTSMPLRLIASVIILR